MSTLRDVLQEAGRRRVAVGHFNFSELVVLKAAAEAAGELGVPVVWECQRVSGNFWECDRRQRWYRACGRKRVENSF